MLKRSYIASYTGIKSALLQRHSDSGIVNSMVKKGMKQNDEHGG